MRVYIALFCWLLLAGLTAQKEDCISGTIVDGDTGDPLIAVALMVEGTTTGTVTDVDGHFELCELARGSTIRIVISYTGFESITRSLSVGKQGIKVKLTPSNEQLSEVVVMGYGKASKKRNRPNQSVMAYSAAPTTYGGADPGRAEQYNEIKENGIRSTKEAPISTLSTDVDRAAYANVRRFLNEGTQPPADAVRIEEMINYFRYNDPLPRGEDPVATRMELTDCPWNENKQLLRIGVRAKGLATANMPPANFVFLLDVSGSMFGPDRLGLVKRSLKMLLPNLRPVDKVSIVVYAGAAGLVLPPTPGDNRAKIEAALDELQAGGSTAGGAGIQLAYNTARRHFVQGGNNRVILVTDGDFNVGTSDQDSLVKIIERNRASGVYLTVLGVGRGNYQEGTMQELADRGNGNHAYLDGISEARKVMVDEFGGTLYTVAKDVKLQIEFNPERVDNYRLIGYENRLLETEDFDDDTKDAAELGAGHVVTVLYEIEAGNNATVSLGELRLRYKKPDQGKSEKMTWQLPGRSESFDQASGDMRWSATVAEFGMLLRNSEYKGTSSYDHCLSQASSARGRDFYGYREEMIQLIKKAKSL